MNLPSRLPLGSAREEYRRPGVRQVSWMARGADTAWHLQTGLGRLDLL